MAGVFIYSNALKQHFSFVSVDDGTYSVMKLDANKDKSKEILWERENVELQQIEDSRTKRINLVKKLNQGQEINLEKELAKYFT